MNRPRISMFALLFITLFGAMPSSSTADASPGDFTLELNLFDFCEGAQSPLADFSHFPSPTPRNSNCVNCSTPLEPNGGMPKLNSTTLLKLNDPTSKRATCQALEELAKANGNHPIKLQKKDQDGNTWRFKFYFGPIRTRYFPTDIKLSSSRVNVVIKDYTFGERTSMSYYNPANWKKFQNAFQWIDEPTNTFIFEFQKGKNAFFLNIFHPKFLTNGDDVPTHSAHVVGTVDQIHLNQEMQISDDAETSPDHLGIRIQNTYRQINWQIGYGYGRKFTLLNSKNTKIVVMPHVAFGITTGKSQTAFVDASGTRTESVAQEKFQGLNLSAGNRVELEKGRFSLFLDQSMTYSHLKHPFLDGTATYNLNYLTHAVGVSFQIYQQKK